MCLHWPKHLSWKQSFKLSNVNILRPELKALLLSFMWKQWGKKRNKKMWKRHHMGGPVKCASLSLLQLTVPTSCLTLVPGNCQNYFNCDWHVWKRLAMSTKHSLRWAWREGGKERENWMCVHKVCFSDSGFQEPAVCVWLVRIWTIFPWSSLNVEKILKYLQEKLYVWDLL